MKTQFTDKLEHLLMTKSYSCLNKEEKEYVESFVSEEEYITFSAVLKEFANDFVIEEQKLQISNKVLPNLQSTFQKKYNPFNKGARTKKYQAAAAVLMFALALFSLIKFSKNEIVNEQAEYYLSEAEFNKHTQWGGLCLEVSEEALEDDVTQELMNMQISN